MKWDRNVRQYWDVGERRPFRLSKDACRDLVYALVACGGQIHSTFSLDIRGGTPLYDMKPHQCAALFRVSLPVGAEETFEGIMGSGTLEEPVQVTLN